MMDQRAMLAKCSVLVFAMPPDSDPPLRLTVAELECRIKHSHEQFLALKERLERLRREREERRRKRSQPPEGESPES
jgi:hypothetical protein